MRSFINNQRSSARDVSVVTEMQGTFKKVVGTIEIDEPADKVWPIIVNPYEFQYVFPRLKHIELLRDESSLSLMKIGLDCGILLKITYVVESKYVPNELVSFRRIAGNLKQFDGYWRIEPLDNGKRSKVIYALSIDPGIPIPQWLVREAIKIELPKTLRALRQRVDCTSNQPPFRKTILAARATSS